MNELCLSVPTQMRRQAAKYELLRRQAEGYRQRMDALRAEEDIFGKCCQGRPKKGKYKNSYSREEAGTIGNIVRSVRTSNPYICVTCKSKKMY